MLKPQLPAQAAKGHGAWARESAALYPSLMAWATGVDLRPQRPERWGLWRVAALWSPNVPTVWAWAGTRYCAWARGLQVEKSCAVQRKRPVQPQRPPLGWRVFASGRLYSPRGFRLFRQPSASIFNGKIGKFLRRGRPTLHIGSPNDSLAGALRPAGKDEGIEVSSITRFTMPGRRTGIAHGRDLLVRAVIALRRGSRPQVRAKRCKLRPNTTQQRVNAWVFTFGPSRA